MGRPLRDKIPEKTSISFTSINLIDMQKSIDQKEFKSVVELVNHCIRYFYENRNRDQENFELMRKYFESEEGDKKMLDLMMRAMEMKMRGTKSSKD